MKPKAGRPRKDGGPGKIAQETFNALCQEGETPEAIVLKVMRGCRALPYGPNETASNEVVTDRQYEAAKALLPFRLPRLNSVDATTKNVTLSHEQWLEALDGED